MFSRYTSVARKAPKPKKKPVRKASTARRDKEHEGGISQVDLMNDYRWLLEQADHEQTARLIDEGGDLTAHWMLRADGVYASPLPILCARGDEDYSEEEEKEDLILEREAIERLLPDIDDEGDEFPEYAEEWQDYVQAAEDFNELRIAERVASTMTELKPLIEEQVDPIQLRINEEYEMERELAEELAYLERLAVHPMEALPSRTPVRETLVGLNRMEDRRNHYRRYRTNRSWKAQRKGPRNNQLTRIVYRWRS